MPKSPRQAIRLFSQIRADLTSRFLSKDTDVTADAPREVASATATPPTKEANCQPLEEQLQIPVRTDSPEGDLRQSLQNQGQFLARQERWGELSETLLQADSTQNQWPGSANRAEDLAFGARADVVFAVEHALNEQSQAENEFPENKVLTSGVMALEALRKEHADDPYLTAVIALAHIDIAWLWRSSMGAVQASEGALRRAAAHFDRASTLLQPLQEKQKNSPFLSAAICALYAGRSSDTMQVADAYAELIDLSPFNYRHMRALGLQMLPRANGSYAALELEARRTAARTQEQWGAGGYTWTYFDAIAVDEQACARVDPQYFLDGIEDILCTDPSQEMINLLTAYCTVTLQAGLGQSAPADKTRLEIAKTARWLARNHLHELHPLIWAHAAKGFDNNARVSSLSRFAAHGKAQGLETLASIFREEIASGHRISFSEKGFDLMSV